jgi:predicted amidohydrolase
MDLISMIIGYIQSDPEFGEKEKNFDQIERLIADSKADLVVLPELFATGYAFNSREEALLLAEPVKGDTARFLKIMARRIDGIVVAGFIEKEGEFIYNSSMIVSKEGVLGTYRKIHLYYKEKLWFTPGDNPLKVFEVNDARIGIMICFDWIFPETARTLALRGADIIAHPANLVLPYCQDAMVTRCLENRIYAITANRIGRERRGSDDFKFTGCSQVTSPDGERMLKAPSDVIDVKLIKIDVNLARNKRLNDYNNLFEDRRSSFYHI